MLTPRRHGGRQAIAALDAELRRLRLGWVEMAPWLAEPGGEWVFDPLGRQIRR